MGGFDISEFDELFGDKFFIIDSNNLEIVKSKLYGFAIHDNKIIQNESYDDDTIFDGNGTYIQVIKSGEDISIYQDFNGSFGIYIFEKDDYFAISNSFIKLVDYIKCSHKITLNEDYAKYFISISLCSLSYSETLVNEIKVLPKNYSLNINLNTKSISLNFIDYKEQSISINSDEGIEILDNWFYRWTTIFRDLKFNTNNISFQLSGGFDSRLSLALLLSSNINLNEILFYSIDDDKHTHKADFEIASEISNYFGFKLNDNTIQEDRIYFKEIETPINISFYTKLGIHKQMFYTYSYKLNPVYSITGYGGECIRKYWDYSSEVLINNLSNRAKSYSSQLIEPTENIIKNSFNQLNNDFEKKDSPHLLYNQTRSKNHFGKLSAEFVISNLIKLSPLLDVDLHRLKLSDKGCDDDNLLVALIFARYCPDLLKFKFEKNRFIDEDTISYAFKINAKYPFKRPEYELISCNESKNNIIHENNTFKKGDAEKFIEKIFFSKSFRKSFELQFSSELYDELVKRYKNSNYFPLENAYAAIAVIKICDCINYSSYDNSFIENKTMNQNFDIENPHVQTLESEINELKKLINIKDEQIEQNNTEINFLRESFINKNEQIEKYNEEINFLRESFINKNKQINELIEKIKIYEKTEQNLKLYKENYSKIIHESKDNRYFVNYYKQENENKQTEIRYIKKNPLIKKILNPFSYIFLIIKSKSNEISLNLKLYKVMKNSNHFDIGFYLNKNNDLKDSKWEKYLPLELHYICYGFNEKRKFNEENTDLNSKKELLNYLLNN